jgi:hypothetical protein
MDAAIELLESYGLVRDKDSLRTMELSKTKIERLHRKLYATVESKQREDYQNHYKSGDGGQVDPFSFVASRSLSGRADCGAFNCRLEKLDLLGRYAALYATKVFLPLPLSNPEKLSSKFEAAREVSEASLPLLRLRPLIDAGFVFPVVMRSFHRCEHEHAWAGERIEFMQELGDKATRIFQRDFRLRFQLPDKSPSGLPSVYIEGPKDFLEHGRLIMLFNEDEHWRAKSWRYDRNGMVEVRGLRKLEVLHDIFVGIADDTSFYLEYGRKRNARYLASRTGETFLLDLVTRRDEDLSASSTALNTYMNQILPLMGDVPLARLLKIRREERDSFARYRLAVGRFLTEIAKKKKRVGKREIRDAFTEQIEPELVKMKQELNEERRRQVHRVLAGVGAMFASLKLGMFGAIPPLAAAGIGGTLLTKAGVSVCEHGSSVREKNDFYFLLRLTQEQETGG